MPCYCTEIGKYSDDLVKLQKIRSEVHSDYSSFLQRFSDHKVNLADFFGQSNPAFFLVGNLSDLEANIYAYERTLITEGGDWYNLIVDIDADIAAAKVKIEVCIHSDQVFHAEENK